jgi:hypothetical protein
MSTSHKILKFTRLIHLYFGVFITPALIFFAFTGALQTFSLHETTRGSSYKPPAWAVVLGQIHKKQTPIVPPRRLQPPEAAPAHADNLASPDKPHHDHANASPSDAGRTPATPAPDSPPAPKHNPLPLKIFFLLVAIGLFTNSLTGLYMSYKFMRNKALITALLLAGIIIPVTMVLI